MISIIAAVAENNAIGLNNGLLCRLPNDLKHFKRITSGHPVIMGRHTYESLPVKPLPDRKNIVIGRSLAGSPPGCTAANTIEDALRQCPSGEECFVIGGAQIYRQMLPQAQTLYITRIHAHFEADAFFPEIEVGKWQLQSSERHEADEKHAYAYSFEVYARNDSL